MSRESPSESVFERHPRLTLLALLTFAFITIDLITTYATSLVRSQKSPLHAPPTETDHNTAYRQASSVYHHDLRPNSSNRETWENRVYTVHSDSLGFKSDRVKFTPLSSERLRIVFIGDSFTEGIGVEYESTFVGRIAQALAGKGIEVLNAGVSTYSPIIYWRKVKHLIEDVGLELDELIVYLDISDIEDEAKYYRLTERDTVERAEQAEPERAEPESRSTQLKAFIRERLMFTFFVLNLSHDLLFIQVASRGDRSRWTVEGRLMDSYGRKGLETAAYHMNLL